METSDRRCFPTTDGDGSRACCTWSSVAGLIVFWAVRRSPDPVFVNAGYLLAAGILILTGIYCLIVGWSLDVDEEEALRMVADLVDHPVGHASAQMGWRGWTSRPTWRILWYSAEEPPRYRGLALIDGHDGRILDSLVEDNPEDWGDLDGRLDQTM